VNGVLSVPVPGCPVRATVTGRRGDEVAIRATVAVRADDPVLRGHFPGQVILPGVFVVETLCQAMRLAGPDDRPPVLSAVRSMRFLAPVVAGDELTLDVTAAAHAEGWQVAATGYRRDGTVTARVRADFDRAEPTDA
jgi:3-hydroxyacyl-[acyl-carrier-protein] dehydratase